MTNNKTVESIYTNKQMMSLLTLLCLSFYVGAFQIKFILKQR